MDFIDRDYRFVAIDVETANGNRHSICQVGMAMVANDGRVDTHGFFVDPDEPFHSFNSQLHGIDAGTVRGSPRFAGALAPLRSFLERHALIQHSNFDKMAFDAACARGNLAPLTSAWSDSVRIARKAWPELRGQGGHGLGNLKKVLNLNFRHHDAVEDAWAAAQVVLLAEERTGQGFAELGATAATRARFPAKIGLPGNEQGPFFGQSVCFTGRLGLDRMQAACLAAQAGFEVRTGVTKALTLLVVGDQDADAAITTKQRRAQDLIAKGADMRILTETEFGNLLTI
ncbi:exonuclease domain-containing protein [Paracoccus sediminilitoris]|uniref:exonuclease domain-containing protein n=1 Tax=Paracoccus sediminilitoris TaxID=2202419 RepID=UPI000DBA52ED|nr:exonuclease domain-containing protein [Paracoccus sediminilitoris]